MDQTTIVFLVLSVLGVGLFIAGVAVLLGLGWALLAAAGSCGLAASFVRKGVKHE